MLFRSKSLPAVFLACFLLNAARIAAAPLLNAEIVEAGSLASGKLHSVAPLIPSPSSPSPPSPPAEEEKGSQNNVEDPIKASEPLVDAAIAEPEFNIPEPEVEPVSHPDQHSEHAELFEEHRMRLPIVSEENADDNDNIDTLAIFHLEEEKARFASHTLAVTVTAGGGPDEAGENAPTIETELPSTTSPNLSPSPHAPTTQSHDEELATPPEQEEATASVTKMQSALNDSRHDSPIEEMPPIDVGMASEPRVHTTPPPHAEVSLWQKIVLGIRCSRRDCRELLTPTEISKRKPLTGKWTVTRKVRHLAVEHDESSGDVDEEGLVYEWGNCRCIFDE